MSIVVASGKNLGKCSVCGKPAVVYLAYARRRLCREHFVEYIERRVEKTIERYRLISGGDRVVIGVSGGKDSVALLNIIAKLYKDKGVEIIPVHIDLGIPGYSEKLREAFTKLTLELGIPGLVIKVEKILEGDGIPEFARKSRRPTCSVCGLVKRYLLNLVALELGATKVATGHNLDDVLAYALKSLINLELEQLAKQGPSTPTVGTAVGRIKPLYEVSEKEARLYAEYADLPFVAEHCPYRPEKSIEYINKRYLDDLEKQYPGIKISIARKVARYSRNAEIKGVPRRCKYCGQPSEGDVCAFCRLTEKIYGRPLGPRAVEYVRSLVGSLPRT